MAKVGFVQNRIRKIEGFDVRILNLKGRDVRDDRTALPGYPYKNATPEAMTVAKWRSSRFAVTYPAFLVQVLDSKGKPVHGRTLLRNVRSTY